MAASEADVVPEDFEFLTRDAGFSVLLREKGTSFDDACVILSSGNLLLRFSRSKGDLFIEASSQPGAGTWLDLDLVRVLVAHGDPGVFAPFNELAVFLRRHLSTVKVLFSQDNIGSTIERLEQLGRERIRKLFPGDGHIKDT